MNAENCLEGLVNFKVEVKEEELEREEDEQENVEVFDGLWSGLTVHPPGTSEGFCTSEAANLSEGRYGTLDRSCASTLTLHQQTGNETSFQFESNSKKGPKGKMSTRQNSSLWNHFTKFEQNKKAKCNYCKYLISFAGGSTSNLSRHLKRKHSTVPLLKTEETRSRSPLTDKRETDIECKFSPFQEEDATPFTSQPTEEGLSTSSSASACVMDSRNRVQLAHSVSSVSQSRSRQGSLNSSGESPKGITKYEKKTHSVSSGSQSRSRPGSLASGESPKGITKYEKNAIDIQMTKLFCKEYLPFRIVESEEFKKLITMLCPEYELPCSKTIYKGLLPSLYSAASENMHVKLSQATEICITCESWKSINNSTFYALTAHYLDKDMKPNSYLVECSEFFEGHSAENVSSWLDDVLEKWNLKEKIVAAVTDDAPNIKDAINALSIRQVSCFAHNLNLIVQNAIDQSIRNAVKKVKTIVQYFKSSSSALEKLHEMQANLNKSPLKLINEVPTRWNSILQMIKSVLGSKLPIISTLTFLQPHNLPHLKETEWELLEHAVNLLNVFEEVTNEISEEDNVPLSKTCVLSRLIIKKIKTYLEKEREQRLPTGINSLGKNLLEGLSQWFGDTENNELISRTVLLDPRFKKQGFGDQGSFKATYDALAKRIMELRASLPSQPTNSIQPEPQKPSNSVWDDFDEAMEQLKASSNPTAAAIVELDKYLAEEALVRTSDPLDWWSERKKTYPNLYELARRHLCIPATSVPCVRFFSKAEPSLAAKRATLESSAISQIVFVNANME